MAGWKISTFLFAGATLVLFGRELLREGPGAPRAQTRTELPAVPVPTAPDEPLPPPPPAPPPPDLPAGDLAYAVLIGGPQRSWEERLALLEPRRDDIVRVLEGWIARADEVYAAKGSLDLALIAYARLHGKTAVPLLERLAIEREHEKPGIDAVEALAWVEDPDATLAILRLQARQPPDCVVIPTFHLLGRANAAADVVRAWEAVPALREHARQAMFLAGSPEDRDRVWRSADHEERRDLMRFTGFRWKEWDSIYLEAAKQFVQSEDPRDRLAALHVILRCPEAFPKDTVAGAERVLAADLAAAPADSRGLLTRIKGEWDALRNAREREERIRAVLLR